MEDNERTTTLREWLTQQERSQGWLARKIGVTSTYLSAVLSGRYRWTEPLITKLEEFTKLTLR